MSKPVTVTLTPDSARWLSLPTDGGQTTLYGAAFLAEGEDAASGISLCLDPELKFQVMMIAILGFESQHGRPPPTGTYPYGGNSRLPVEHDSYLQTGPREGPLVGFDGGTVLTTSNEKKLTGTFEFSEDVQPPTFCATCPDGLIHYGVSGSFDLNAYPGNRMPYRGVPPANPFDDG